jgi:hypothetical protein
VSTYADYPVYYLTYRPGRPHISNQHPEWAAYFRSVRACLDRVDAEGKDERTRSIMRSRWLRVEALSRLRGDAYERLASPALLHEVRTLIVDRYDPAELMALKPIDRMLAALLVDGREHDMRALAHWESSAEVTSRVSGAEIRDDVLQIEVRSTLTSAPPPAGLDSADPRYPTESELLDQLATFTRVGLELEHTGTKVRRPMQVKQLGEGRTVATLSLTEEPLASGRWSVLVGGGEHRSRRRRKIALDRAARVGPVPIRAGDKYFALLDDGRLRLQVGATAAEARPPLIRRIKRRISRAIGNGPVRRLVELSPGR